MSGTTKVLTFSEGVSVSAPSQSFLSASNIQVYADDAAYVSAKGSAAIDGNCYYNSTTDLIRYYSNGAWSNLIDDDSVQSIANKSFIDSTTTFEDNADPTRKFKFELSGVSPSTTRTITIPDVDITPVGVANNETISGTKSFSAITTFSNTTDSSSKDTGGVILEGGLGVEKNVYIGGNLVVKGTTTSIESTTLEVTDANITVNKGGNQAAADDVAGLTVEMSDATHAKILFDKDATSKFKVGAAGSEKEIATISDSQIFTNKTLTSPTMSTPTVSSGGEVFATIATPSTPASGYVTIYPKSDGNVYKLNSSGVESLIGSGTATVACVSDPAQTPTGTVSGTMSVAKFTIANDTHSAYSASTGLYTIPIAGYYSCTCLIEHAATYAQGNRNSLELRKNGSTIVYGSTQLAYAASTSNVQLTYTLYCNLNDTLGWYSSDNGTTPSYTATYTGSNFSIHRVQ